MKGYNSNKQLRSDENAYCQNQNLLSSHRFENMSIDQKDKMYKEFQTLKQINRILDSNPQSEEAKEQKIRSLVVMFKRQLDINKKLQNKVSEYDKKLQGCEKELIIRDTQVKNYQKTIIKQKQQIINLERENKILLRKFQQRQQEVKIRQEFIQKLRESHSNQLYSMENQLHYLKQKALDHFKEKVNNSLQSRLQCEQPQKIKRPKSHSRAKSERKNISNQNSTNKNNAKAQNIIRRNILALSNKQNDLKTGQKLLKKFQENKLLTERMNEIKKGNYMEFKFDKTITLT